MKVLTYVSGLSAALVLGIGLSGCGGGGSSSTQTAAINTGTFIDAPVQGLSYSTATLSGTTDANGHFKYKNGEKVTFEIGKLVLGTVDAKKTITPLTLAGDTNVSNPSPKAVNIARILQSFDANTSDTSKIVIPDALNKDLNITDVNWSDDSNIISIVDEASTLLVDRNITLKPAVDAEIEMKNSFQKDIYAGTYSVTATFDAKASSLDAGDCGSQEQGTAVITPDGNVTAVNVSGSGSATGNATFTLNGGQFSGTASDGTAWSVTIDEDGKMSGTYNWGYGSCVGTISGSKISDQTTTPTSQTITSPVSGKIITVDANTTAIFSSDGNYSEYGWDYPTSPYSCSGKWTALSDTEIAMTCDPNGTSSIPTLSDAVVKLGTTGLPTGSTVTFYPNGLGSSPDSATITAIEDIPFVLDKTITIDNDTNATFSSNGDYAENGYNGANQTSPYACSGKWISLSNSEIAMTCEPGGTLNIPTSSGFVIDFGTATLSKGSTVTLYPKGINDTTSSFQATITAIN